MYGDEATGARPPLQASDRVAEGIHHVDRGSHHHRSGDRLPRREAAARIVVARPPAAAAVELDAYLAALGTRHDSMSQRRVGDGSPWLSRGATVGTDDLGANNETTSTNGVTDATTEFVGRSKVSSPNATGVRDAKSKTVSISRCELLARSRPASVER